jgi:hypothetical protein
MIESPLLDEARELIRAQAEAEFQEKGRAEGRLQTLRELVREELQTRFEKVPEDLIASLDSHESPVT